MKKIVSFSLMVMLVCLLLAGCGSSASKKFAGIWYGYRVSTDNVDIYFEDYEAIAKMEMTCEFKSDGKYIVHYYVNDKEGEKYPQEGTYKIDGEKIILDGGDGVGEIVNGELILRFSDGAVRQYFKRNK